MENETPASFPSVVDQFIEKTCDRGPDLSVPDTVLFPKFRKFWQQITNDTRYPALLGQFRVELTQQGYRSSDGKRPRWYGVALKKRTSTPSVKTRTRTAAKKRLSPSSTSRTKVRRAAR